MKKNKNEKNSIQQNRLCRTTRRDRMFDNNVLLSVFIRYTRRFLFSKLFSFGVFFFVNSQAMHKDGRQGTGGIKYTL